MSIVLDGVSFGYNQEKLILDNLSLTINKGRFIGLAGSNGSGKSTFTYILNGIIPHHFRGYFQGQVLVDGISTKKQKIGQLAGKVGLMFQNPEYSIFNLTVEEEVAFGVKNLGLDKPTQRINDALEAVGLKDKKKEDPHQLSMGQKQKLALACILALDSEYIILDEPSAMLDYRSSIEIYKHLQKLNKEGKTIITIEHDTDYFWQFCQDILLLDQGKILNYGPKEDIFKETFTLKNLGIKIPNTNDASN
jgi:energy-coupling factor transport system ATP-binding protein